MKKDFSIEEAIKFGWETFKKNIAFFIGVTIILILITGTLGFLGAITEEANLLVKSLVFAVGNIVNALIAFGYNTIIPLKLIDNEQPEINDLFGGVAYFGNFFVATLLVSWAVSLGIILLIIPGVYAAIIFFFYSFFIYDKDLGAVESIKASMKLTEGARWKILGLLFVIAGINLLGALACGIGLFATIPTSVMAVAYVYRTLLSQTPDEDMPSAKPEADFGAGRSIDP